jgi:hypothetical protein
MIFCVKVSQLTGVRVCTVYIPLLPRWYSSHYCTTTEVYYFNFVVQYTVTKVICF